MDAEKALKVLDEVIRRTTVQMPTPLGQRGESTMHPVHFCDYLHEIRQAREYFASALSPPAHPSGRSYVSKSEMKRVETIREHPASAAVVPDTVRQVLREFQDGRRISNPHTRQVARDIEQQISERMTIDAATPSPPVGEKGDGS